MSSLGFLGPRGTFTEVAAKEYQQEEVEYIPYNDIQELVKAVSNSEIEQAVVPLENSIQGGVTLTLDLLVEYDVKIIAEVVIPISHSLLVKDNMELSKIKHIISHTQALSQCRNFLEYKLEDYQVHLTSSTAEGIKKLLQLDNTWAAIGNSKASDYYNLQVLAEDIQDNQQNWTKFIVLAKQEIAQDENHKTSIICSVAEDHSGALYDILHEFAIRGINLTRIESRPAKKLLGDYIFFIDFEGDYREFKVKAALDLVKYKTDWYKFLGSYPQLR